MARKIVAVHGIGNAQPGWSEPLRLDLGIPQSNWIEFCYDDLMDQSWFNRLVVLVGRILLYQQSEPNLNAIAKDASEHINDIVSYFLSKRSRVQIQLRLKAVLQENPDALILSHSLGTVIAYETLKTYNLNAYGLMTFGSPLSKALVRRYLDVPNVARPRVIHWYNIWGTLDPISGKIEGLGCRLKDQLKIKNSHNLLAYVHSQRKRILNLYGNTAQIA